MPKPGSTTRRGYGYQHQQVRDALTPTIQQVGAECTEPRCLVEEDSGSRWIEAGTPGRLWDLAHDREATAALGYAVYRGPAHRRCNRAEGARWRHAALKQPRFFPL